VSGMRNVLSYPPINTGARQNLTEDKAGNRKKRSSSRSRIAW
jgi:hypothetical protein